MYDEKGGKNLCGCKTRAKLIDKQGRVRRKRIHKKDCQYQIAPKEWKSYGK